MDWIRHFTNLGLIKISMSQRYRKVQDLLYSDVVVCKRIWEEISEEIFQHLSKKEIVILDNGFRSRMETCDDFTSTNPAFLATLHIVDYRF